MSSPPKAAVREKKPPSTERIGRKVANPYDRLARLRGKVEFSIDLDTMRHDRT
jgi:hypothetical protein